MDVGRGRPPANCSLSLLIGGKEVKMKLTDIIALSKAGFKAAEIKKMIAEAGQDEPQVTVPDTAPEDVMPDEPAAADVPDQEPEPERDPETVPEKDPEMQKQIDDLKKQLKEAQRKNINQQVPPAEPNSDKLIKMVNEFYG